jgi:hypothetical protein
MARPEGKMADKSRIQGRDMLKQVTAQNEEKEMAAASLNHTGK